MPKVDCRRLGKPLFFNCPNIANLRQIVKGCCRKNEIKSLPFRWHFRYYVAADGSSDIVDAYKRGGAALQARFLSRLREIAQLPHEEWRDRCKMLSGECSGLSEIRFKANGVQQRPLGYRSGINQYTILFWAEERGAKWVPRDACARAIERKTSVRDGKCRTDELWIAIQ